MSEHPATLESPLSGFRVGISGAVPERELWGSAVDLDRQILVFVSRLAGFVMEYGGTIVHGSHPALTPAIAEQAWDERQDRGADGPNPLTLVGSQLFGNVPEITERAARRAGADVILTPQLGPGDATDARTRNASLTGMRMVMAGQVDVQVAIGGKLHRDTGFNPGVLEELAIMRWNGVRCFVVASFGGIAGELEATTLHHFSDGNLLAEDEVAQMATWSRSEGEYVGSLLAHFARHRDAFVAHSDASPARRIRFRPGPQLPGLMPTRVAEIDPMLVEATGKGFAELKTAISKGDNGRVSELLSTLPV
jgi:hypothetical protein